MNELATEFIEIPEDLNSLLHLSVLILEGGEKVLAIASVDREEIGSRLSKLMSRAKEDSGLEADRENRDEWLLAKICVWIFAYYKIDAKINEETMMAGGNQKTIGRTWSRIFCLLGMMELMRDDEADISSSLLSNFLKGEILAQEGRQRHTRPTTGFGPKRTLLLPDY